jgi:hypothetical protein
MSTRPPSTHLDDGQPVIRHNIPGIPMATPKLSVKSIAVIGAGPTGITMAKYALWNSFSAGKQSN